MTTIKDLSRILDLSPSTVSKALNGKEEISNKTILRVKKVAKANGYHPNNIAQCLKLKKTKKIGVIVPNINCEFFGEVIQSIEHEADLRGYMVIVAISNNSFKKEEKILESLINGNVDGLIISLAQETQQLQDYNHISQLNKFKIPLILFDRVYDDLQCDKIIIDDFDGAYRASSHLIKTGRKNIAFLSTISRTSIGELRKEGYCQAMQLEGDNHSRPIILNVKELDLLESMLKTIIENERIDAILAADQVSAICALNIVQRAGFNVPQDISIIGFANSTMTKYSNPPMTIVTQRAEDMGKAAFNVLLDRINNVQERDPINQILRTELIIRDST